MGWRGYKGLQVVVGEEHSRDLTNLDLMGRGDEEGGWENVYSLFNNSERRCGIIEV